MKGPDRVRTLAERLRGGGLALVLDDALDPPEAMLACAAARVTPAAVNFMATHGRGLVCLGLTRDRMRRPRHSAHGDGRDRAAAGVWRVDRGATRRVHRDQRVGSRHDDPGGVPPRRDRGRRRDARTRDAHPAHARRQPGAGRAPRGGERSDAAGGHGARGGALRGARQRRQPGHRRRARRPGPQASSPRRDRGRGRHDAPAVRHAGATPYRGAASAARRADVPGHRLRQQHRPAAAHRAGRRRTRAATATCWSVCIPSV